LKIQHLQPKNIRQFYLTYPEKGYTVSSQLAQNIKLFFWDYEKEKNTKIHQGPKKKLRELAGIATDSG
jgi:hypothetical protein